MTDLTLTIPDELASRLAPFEEQLPQIIERGLARFEASAAGPLADLREVLERLALLPSPEEVLALRPPAELRERISVLLDKNVAGGLTPAEEAEFAQYELMEHLLRVAKASAQLKLSQA